MGKRKNTDGMPQEEIQKLESARKASRMYREKIKNNPSKYEEFKELNRERVNRYKEKLMEDLKKCKDSRARKSKVNKTYYDKIKLDPLRYAEYKAKQTACKKRLRAKNKVQNSNINSYSGAQSSFGNNELNILNFTTNNMGMSIKLNSLLERAIVNHVFNHSETSPFKKYQKENCNSKKTTVNFHNVEELAKSSQLDV